MNELGNLLDFFVRKLENIKSKKHPLEVDSSMVEDIGRIHRETIAMIFACILNIQKNDFEKSVAFLDENLKAMRDVVINEFKENLGKCGNK
jgi:hypothetical protein